MSEAGAPIPRDVRLPGGRLVENLVHFARVLRACGLPIGPGKVIDAVEAVRAVGITNRQDFYWTLHAVFVNRHAQRELFDQAFHVFWRNPRWLERMMSLVLPEFRYPDSPAGRELSRRLGEALHEKRRRPKPREEQPPEPELDATLTWSSQEVLRTKDFEQMSAEEIEQARRAIARMRLGLRPVATRRYRPHRRGNRIDMRATLRSALRAGPGVIPLVRARRRERPPALVILCDISGSMTRYSRMLLHFAHALTSDRDRVHSFLFGTRLTNVTRQLRERDVDVALGRIAERVEDWSGGTRIGTALHAFNHDWSRRVLGQGAVVLLITDGLDRDAGEGLGREMERLHKSCRRLVWLNPLLRYDRFEPRALGMRAMLPHVDEMRAVHSLDSLEALTEALSRPTPRREEGVTPWLTPQHLDRAS
ncbi:MAG: VWA domain-containing protein [Ectothiorhodospiraceae bacterium]|nr:VWA domain-containing protein [Chromatiales bacterium]MCP5157001.1 VWA domain-containing protein [Ectothiorhodospiraceae bacterium]